MFDSPGVSGVGFLLLKPPSTFTRNEIIFCSQQGRDKERQGDSV
jgi:hypothetical protein